MNKLEMKNPLTASDNAPHCTGHQTTSPQVGYFYKFNGLKPNCVQSLNADSRDN